LTIPKELPANERQPGLQPPPETLAGAPHREQDEVVGNARNGRQTGELLLIHLSYAINRLADLMGWFTDRIVVERM